MKFINNSKLLFLLLCSLTVIKSNAQTMKWEEVRDAIEKAHPTFKMYDAEIRAMDEAAKGARSWMPPEVGTGLFMFPYNPKYAKKDDMGEAMGNYMISVQQMFPNKKRQNAEYAYMSAMSSSEKERKNAAGNELIAEAKRAYYDWVILKKKSVVLDQNEKLLDFMIKNAEIRYKNSMDKLNAYYKIKAAMGKLQNMRLMLENDVRMKQIALNTLMDRDASTAFDIDTSHAVKDLSALTIDSAKLVSSRSDIRALERDMQLASLQRNLESARLKPEFGIRYEHMTGFGGQPAQYTAMAMMRLPFARWSSRMNRANIESLTWRKEALRFQKNMILNELAGMAATMKTEYETKQRQLKLFEQNIIPALRNNYKVMQLGYEQNTEELFMLYDAWETLNMTQLEYLDQQQQLLRLQVEIERILEIK